MPFYRQQAENYHISWIPGNCSPILTRKELSHRFKEMKRIGAGGQGTVYEGNIGLVTPAYQPA